MKSLVSSSSSPSIKGFIATKTTKRRKSTATVEKDSSTISKKLDEGIIQKESIKKNTIHHNKRYSIEKNNQEQEFRFQKKRNEFLPQKNEVLPVLNKIPAAAAEEQQQQSLFDQKKASFLSKQQESALPPASTANMNTSESIVEKITTTSDPLVLLTSSYNEYELSERKHKRGKQDFLKDVRGVFFFAPSLLFLPAYSSLRTKALTETLRINNVVNIQVFLLSSAIFWKEIAAMALLDIMYTAMAKSLPLIVLKRHYFESQRREKQKKKNKKGRQPLRLKSPSAQLSSLVSSSSSDEEHFDFFKNKSNSTAAVIDTTMATTITAAVTKRGARGLQNYGQTCFLNSTLQALASLDSFLVYLDQLVLLQQQEKQSLLKRSTNSQNKDNSKNDNDNGIAYILSYLLHTINGDSVVHLINATTNNNKSNKKGSLFHHFTTAQHTNTSTGPVDPRQVLDCVGEKHCQFRRRTLLFNHSSSNASGGVHEQQDAQELLQALMDLVISLYSNSLKNENNKKDGSIMIHSEFMHLQCPLRHEDSTGELLTFFGKMQQELGGKQKNKDTQTDNKHTQSNNSNNQHVAEEKKQEEGEEFTANRQHQNDDLLGNLILDGEEDDYDYDYNRTSHNRQKNGASSEGPSLLLPLSATAVAPTNKESNNSNNNSMILDSISPITPSPLNGWIGSTLQCAQCHHVRPIQNAPFLDIPIVPTSILDRHSSSPCSLEVCLQNYTSVERVTDVECRNCTKLQQLRHWKEELEMLEAAMRSLEKRGKPPSTLLQHDLRTAKLQYNHWLHADPDEDLHWIYSIDNDDDDTNVINAQHYNDTIPVGVGATISATTNTPLLRGDAWKCLLLTRPPTILCLHIQRRHYNPIRDDMEKAMQHVQFDLELNLGPYCAYHHTSNDNDDRDSSSSNNNIKKNGFTGKHISNNKSDTEKKDMNNNNNTAPLLYLLKAVIEHVGDAYGGHYVTYRRNPSSSSTYNNNNNWIRVSDDKIVPLSWSRVRKAQAYMLFYEAVSTTKPTTTTKSSAVVTVQQ